MGVRCGDIFKLTTTAQSIYTECTEINNCNITIRNNSTHNDSLCWKF